VCLAEGHENGETGHPEGKHHGECGPVADILWMVALHIAIIGNRSDSYDAVTPE
jgi:hypothetical protein